MSESDKGEHKISRRHFWMLLLAGGAGATQALLTACSPRDVPEEEGVPIPTVLLPDLIEQPELFSSLPLMKTSGYPESVGETTINMPMPYVDTDNTTKIRWISTTVQSYKLHTLADKESPSMEFSTTSQGFSTISAVPLPSHGQDLSQAGEYEVTGRVVKIKANVDGVETEKYIIEPHRVDKKP